MPFNGSSLRCGSYVLMFHLLAAGTVNIPCGSSAPHFTSAVRLSGVTSYQPGSLPQNIVVPSHVVAAISQRAVEGPYPPVPYISMAMLPIAGSGGRVGIGI